VTERSAGSLSHGTILKEHPIRPSRMPRGRFYSPATEQSWAVVPGMYGTPVNIIHWYPC